MFKCKQCGYQFSANIPDQCPECGAINQQPINDARGVSILLTMEAISTLIFLILIALLVGWIAGWF